MKESEKKSLQNLAETGGEVEILSNTQAADNQIRALILESSTSIEIKSSVLPTPEELEKYAELGYADTILSIVKAEQDHRHQVDNKQLELDNRDLEISQLDIQKQSRGQVLAACIAFGFIGVTAFAIAKGQEIAGIAAIVSGVAALVVAFVVGRKDQE